MLIKKYLSLAKQIELFENSGLVIDDYKEFEYFLSMNKYYEIIEYYCEPFMKKFNKSTMNFDYNSSSKEILELVDYDSCISTIVFRFIKIVEKSFSSKIIYFISMELKEESLVNNKNIFSNFYKVNKLLRNVKNENNLDFISNCSFGVLLEIFKNLNENIQYKIINSYNGLKLNKNQFILIFNILITIRNNIAHFKSLYNFKIETEINILKKFLKNNNLDYELNNKKLDLFLVIKIINKILSNKFSSSLEILFKEKTFKKIFKSKIINNNSKNYILKKIGITNNDLIIDIIETNK